MNSKSVQYKRDGGVYYRIVDQFLIWLSKVIAKRYFKFVQSDSFLILINCIIILRTKYQHKIEDPIFNLTRNNIETQK